MQIDGLPKRLERDGSALSTSIIGDVIMRPATARDKALAAVSQLDALGKIVWTVKDSDEVTAGRSFAVFMGELSDPVWQFRVHVLTSISPVLEISGNGQFVRIGGEELVERLYRRLLGKYVHGGLVRRFTDSEVQKQLDQDEKLFRSLVDYCNRI